MSAFEQQVAQALGVDRRFGDAMVCMSCGAPDLGDLASRVAKAIDAARAAVPVRERSRIIDLDQAAGSTYEVWFTAGDDPRKFDYEGEAYKHADELQRQAALAALRGAPPAGPP